MELQGIEELDKLISKLKALDSVILDAIAIAFEEHSETIEDFNTEQLQKGERSDGSILPSYSPASVNVYGKRPGPMTLRDTGDFYRGIKLDISATAATIVSKDIKTSELETRYGTKIIGISDENLESFVNKYVRESILRELNEYFGHD